MQQWAAMNQQQRRVLADLRGSSKGGLRADACDMVTEGSGRVTSASSSSAAVRSQAFAGSNAMEDISYISYITRRACSIDRARSFTLQGAAAATPSTPP